MDKLFVEANKATERMLERNGCKVLEVKSQGCCGALHSHAGEIESARELAKRNIEAFLASGSERIIVNAAGCGAAMKEYGELLADDPDFAQRAHEISSQVLDISEFLVERGVEEGRLHLSKRIAYDAPCHLMYAQHVTQAPLNLLNKISGAELTPLVGFESCCGGAGIYNLQHHELSLRILSGKIDAIRESGVDTVVTGNPGCIMQIGAGVMIEGLKVDVIHPIELLDAAYCKGEISTLS